MNDNDQLTFEGIPEPSPETGTFGFIDKVGALRDKLDALIEFAEAHGVPALPESTFADRLRAKAREVTRG
ncbi:hypothetical protein EBT16_12230 [bacterium]|nr:hypothetical protein [bacterium]